MSFEKIYSCRLVGDEITYMKTYWDDKFSEFVHNSIKKEKNLIKQAKNNKHQLFKDIGLYLVLISLGVIFFIFGIKAYNIVEVLLSFVFGMFLTLFGIIGGLLYALQSTRRRNNE